MSGAHSRYERFQQAQVLSIPARMVGLDSVFDDGSGQRAVGRGRVQRGAPATADGHAVSPPGHALGARECNLADVGATKICRQSSSTPTARPRGGTPFGVTPRSHAGCIHLTLLGLRLLRGWVSIARMCV